MPKGINSVVLDGHLGRDPELKRTNGGQAYCILSLATSTEAKKDDAGQWKDIPQWHRVVVWGEDAEYLAANAHTGDRCAVQGTLTYRSWDKDGQRQYVTEIKATMAKYWPKEGRRPPRDSGSNPPAGFGGITPRTDDIPF